MEEQEILKGLIKILREKFENPVIVRKLKDISATTSLRKDLDMDSLECFELLFYAEKKFNVSIPDEKSVEFKSLNDYKNYIFDYPRT